MTAESISFTNPEVAEEAAEAERLQVVKAANGLSSRAVPKVVEWGPAQHRADFEPVRPATPDDLTFSA